MDIYLGLVGSFTINFLGIKNATFPRELHKGRIEKCALKPHPVVARNGNCTYSIVKYCQLDE